MSKYNKEAVEKEIKRGGIINRNQQVEASLTHRLLKGHQKDELDQEPSESRTDYCNRMGFDM